MRVLLTSPRAPVTLDLARRFVDHGDTVFVCDSLRFACGGLSRHCRRLRVPRPKDSPQQYIERLQEIIDQQKIDWLIPTCEEVFTIAAYRDRLSCDVLLDSFEKLSGIHNKWTFSQTAGNEFANVPESRLLVTRDELQDYRDMASEYVFKPCFSRFASETMISPSIDELESIVISSEKPWIAQRRVIGTEFSTYSVARDGNLIAHACYTSGYRAGRGSGIYFVPRLQNRIMDFVRAFVKQFNYVGQIGFDCLVDDSDVVWILEGNPRATSGLHLFGDEQSLIGAILGNHEQLVVAQPSRPRMLAAAMPIWGLAQALRNRAPLKFAKDCLQGRDVLFRWTDPLPFMMLPLTLGELAVMALREGATLQQVSTRDIEWNGEPL